MKSATNLRKENVRYNSIAVFIRLAVVAKSANHAKFYEIRTYSSSRLPKVIDLGVNRKRICNFVYYPLLVISKCGSISYRFQDIDAFSSKTACFFHSTLA